MDKQAVLSDRAPRPIGPYSQAIRAGDLYFLSGQVAIDPATGRLVPGDVMDQTRRVMDNIVAVLEVAGLTTANVVKTTIFLADLSHFGTVNEIYGSHFKDAPPARSTVQVARLPLDALVEIEVVAAR